MKISANQGIHCGKPGLISTIVLGSVGTPQGILSITLQAFISDAGNFSISGTSRVNGKEDAAGQIIDTLREWGDYCGLASTREKVEWLVRVWDKYHLNDMQPGTPEQMEALGDMPDMPEWYAAACEHLKAKGLYEVQLEGKPYKFGHRWLTAPIPEEHLTVMRAFFVGEEVDLF